MQIVILLPHKKVRAMGASLKAALQAARPDCQVTLCGDDVAIESLPKASLLLHKVNDRAAQAYFLNDSASQQWMDAFHRYVASSGVRLVDDTTFLNVVMDRYAFCQLLSTANLPRIHHLNRFYGRSGTDRLVVDVHLPPFQRVQTVTASFQPCIPFPLVAKRVAACSVSGAHDMYYVSSTDALHPLLHQASSTFEAGTDWLLQSYIPHAPILIKLFVIGTDVYLLLRPSLCLPSHPPDEAMLFNSHTFEKSFKEGEGPDLNEVVTDQEQAQLKDMALKVGPLLNMTLYGVDLVKGLDGRFYLLDVNYFPGYDGVPEAIQKIAHHLLSFFP